MKRTPCKNKSCPQFTRMEKNQCGLFSEGGEIYCRHGYPDGETDTPLLPPAVFAEKHGIKPHMDSNRSIVNARYRTTMRKRLIAG